MFMKGLKLKCFVLLAGLVSIPASCNGLADRVSDEVFDSLIETHTKFLNSNILSEICRTPHFLEINYASKNIRKDIESEIKDVLEQRDIKNSDLKEIRELTELEFQAFQDGTRYGVFVARNQQLDKDDKYCSKEIVQAIKEAQDKSVKTGDFILKERFVR